MTTDQEQTETETMRLATPEELGRVVRMLREMHQWTQETLSAISGLSVRTVQRVERGEQSDFDTRRALARAFEAEDVDIFNKPCAVPSREQMQAEREKFEREHVTLACGVVTSGRALTTAYMDANADHAVPAVELEDDAAGEFAALIDFLRDWRDGWDLVSEVQKLDAFSYNWKFDVFTGKQLDPTLQPGSNDWGVPPPVPLGYLVKD